jgi:hypothetical protein
VLFVLDLFFGAQRSNSVFDCIRFEKSYRRNRPIHSA